MRKPYLDNIKWITVVLVVLYHVVYMYNGVETFGVVGPFQPVQIQDAYQYIVYPWFMLLLFVVSGMCARYSLEHQSVRAFIRVRTRKYLVPSTLGLLVVGWVLGYYNMQLAGAFEPLQSVPKAVLWVIMALSGCGPLWYIQMLWVFSVLLVVFRKLEKDWLYHACAKTPVWLLAAFALPIWGAAQVLNTNIVVYRFGIYGLGFLLGYLVFSHGEVMDRLAEHWRLFTAAAVVCGGGVYLAVLGQTLCGTCGAGYFPLQPVRLAGHAGGAGFYETVGERPEQAHGVYATQILGTVPLPLPDAGGLCLLPGQICAGHTAGALLPGRSRCRIWRGICFV